MPHEKSPLTYFSTFSGIGGFELGIERGVGSQSADQKPRPTLSQTQQRRKWSSLEERRGVLPSDVRRQRPVRCIGYSEVDQYAVEIYHRHFPEHTNYGDITTLEAKALPDFELLVGGFPCQAFSIAGRRGGFSDTRGTLFFEIARIAREKQPRLLLLENVKGLLSHDQGSTFATIITTLDELGYDCQWQVLNSKDFGVPQNRERVFIVGHLRGTTRPEVFPFGEEDKRDTRQVGYDIATCLDGNYYKGTSPNGLQAQRRQLAYTNGIRRLTPTECERLQGFPDGWTEGVSDTQRYKCLGNAVTVNVIEAVSSCLLQ